MDYIELEEGAQGLRPKHLFKGAKAWRAAELTVAHCCIPVSDEARSEAQAIVQSLRRQKLPVCMLSPQMFELHACQRLMTQVRDRLDNGPGVALLDRLPVEDWSGDESRAIYWLLGKLLARPVAQEWNGLMFRDIVDEGGAQELGNERAVTNRVLTFHTDNSGNRVRPDYVGLMSLSAPVEGGESQYCTLYSVFNALAEDAPVSLERLFEPALHDRQGIQSPGEVEVLRAPVLTWDGVRLHGRFSVNKISGGYLKARIEMDEITRRALADVLSSIERRRLACAFVIEPGQVQYLNNLEGLHYRADYVDGEVANRRRHMVRMWFRNHGRPFFDG